MPRRESRARAFRLAASLGLTASALVLWAAPAQAATCPVVAPSTGAVTPAPTVGVQWSGCDLTGADLAGADMSGGSLVGTELANADLAGANLTSTNLISADLTDANLTSAELMQAMLSGTVLTGATLTGVSSGLINGTPASLPSGWLLVSNYLVGPGADLQYAGLSGDLTNANLTGANLTDAFLGQVTLTGAELAGATLTGIRSRDLVGTPASLPADWSVTAGYLLGPGANLTSANLADANLSGLTLTGIDLNSAFLSGTDLAGTDLTDAVLTGANIGGADLTGARLAGEQSGEITGTPASLPPGWAVTGGYLIGPGADLHDASLASLQLGGADLAGADLSGAVLVQASLAMASLAMANLTGADLRNADLTGASLDKADLDTANLGGANLTQAQLAEANLTQANLPDSDVSGASLAGATLTGANGVAITGTPASLPAGWSIRAGYLLGPGTGTSLTDVSLDQVNLSGVDLSGDILLRTALQHANLTGANLTKANLTGADFTDANLTKANLRGATVSSTTFAGTVWKDTTCPDGTSSATHPQGRCFAPPPPSGFTARPLPSPAGAVASSFRPLAISCATATQCHAGGSYEQVGSPTSPSGPQRAALLRWSGQQWTASTAPVPAGALTGEGFATVTGMSCPSVARCLAGGAYRSTGGAPGLLLSWSGKSWTAAPAPLPASATAGSEATVAAVSCPSVTSCFAVGHYTETSNHEYGLLLRWSGGKWAATAAPLPAGSRLVASLGAVSCPSVRLCFAGGWHYDSSAAGHSQLYLLTWAGRNWGTVKVALPAGAAASPQAALDGLSCPTVTQCVAVGSYVDAKGHQQGLLLTRSGSTWTAAKAPLPAGAARSPFASLAGVSCPASSHCTAAGAFTNTASQSVGLLLTWSGKAWKALAAPAAADQLEGISCPTLTRCVAVSNGIGPQVLTGP